MTGLIFTSYNQAIGESEVMIVCDEKEEPQMEVLAGFLREKGNYSVVVMEKKEFPDKTDNLHAIFSYIHRPYPERVEKALMDYVINGGRLINVHHAISSSKVRNKYWLDFCGVKLLSRKLGRDKGGWYVIEDVDAELVCLQPKHYITSHNVDYQKKVTYIPSDTPGVEQKLPALEFKNSEVFLNIHFTDAEQKTVLFGVKAVHPKSGQLYMQDRGGWFQKKGNGWLFYFQMGHCKSDFENSAYCQVLMNCLKK